MPQNNNGCCNMTTNRITSFRELLHFCFLDFKLLIVVFSNQSPTSAKQPVKQHFYHHAAVAADNAECSKVGRNILKKGGSAVDAAIATTLCVGVINMHSTGIGGGGFMMVYDSHKRSAEMIDFRETAPEHSDVDLFKGDPLNGIRGDIFLLCKHQWNTEWYQIDKKRIYPHMWRYHFWLHFVFCPFNYTYICWCMIEKSSDLFWSSVWQSSPIFGYLWKMLGNVRLAFKQFWEIFEKLQNVVGNL